MYINKLDDIVNNFKVGHIIRISKYKNIFAKGYVPDWSGEVIVIKKVKSTVLWTYLISDVKGEEIVGKFYEKKNLQKTNQKKLKAEKVIKIKDYTLYDKWKRYDNSFNSWIDKKDLI